MTLAIVSRFQWQLKKQYLEGPYKSLQHVNREILWMDKLSLGDDFIYAYMCSIVQWEHDFNLPVISLWRLLNDLCMWQNSLHCSGVSIWKIHPFGHSGNFGWKSFEDSWILHLTMLSIAHFIFMPNPFCKQPKIEAKSLSPIIRPSSKHHLSVGFSLPLW